jgi:acyl dehydratase
VTTRTRAFKQDGAQVMEFTRMSLIPKRGHAVGD